MNRIKQFVKYLTRFIPDKLYLTILYYRYFHRLINWRNPKTFTEKLQWLKLYDRNPLYTELADKITVKAFVKKTIGEKYIIPTLQIWDKAENIDLKDLPDKFILKCNHDSHSKIRCLDKNQLDLKFIKKHFKTKININPYYIYREWTYKNIKPYIFAEKLLEDPKGDLVDDKIMCFNGKAKFIEVNSNRFFQDNEKALQETIYDLNWNKTNISQGKMPPSPITLPKPTKLEEMIQLSEKLSQNIPHVRVDWYCPNGELFFGELTFYDGSGLVPFNKYEYDIQIGNWLTLPNKNKKPID